MHSISIKFKKGVDENALWQNFNSLIGAFRENGQVNGREHNPSAYSNF